MAEKNPSGSEHQCSLCGRSFSVRKSLQRHMDTVHCNLADADEKPQHRCSTCGECFSRKDVLARHGREKHESDKVKCEICGDFVSARWLGEHRKSRACRYIQAREDDKQIQLFRGSARIFSFDFCVDPFLASHQTFRCPARFPKRYEKRALRLHRVRDRPVDTTEWQKILCPTYWQLRGLTMRTIERALSDATQAASCAVAAALLTASMADWRLGLTDCIALYQRVFRNIWTSERYQRDSGKLRGLLQSALSTPDMHEGSPCCQKMDIDLGWGNVAWLVDVFGFALIKGCTISELNALH